MKGRFSIKYNYKAVGVCLGKFEIGVGDDISCNGRVTSCFDPISKALKDIFLQNEY
jgi:hypothetical protein